MTFQSNLTSLTCLITFLSSPVGLTEAIILVAGFNAFSLQTWIRVAELLGFGDSGTFHLGGFQLVIGSIRARLYYT